jgi:hypothetical protein
LEWGRNKLASIDLGCAALSKQPFQPFGTARCMEDERDHYEILVISIIDGVRKRIQNNSSKVIMNNPVDLAVLLDVCQASVECGNKASPQPNVSFFVVPPSGLGPHPPAPQAGGEAPSFTQRLQSFFELFQR